MNKYILLLLFIVGSFSANGQCLTNSLTINTGYDPLTGLAITPGIDEGTPVPDPKWIVTYESPGIAAAMTGGLIEVLPGAAADVITTLGGWTSNPAGIPGGWISCVNSDTYTTDGTGPTGTPYNMTLTRPFRTCSADSIKLDFYIANDNYIPAMDVDGILTTFSQPPIAVASTFTGFTHFTQTFYLPAGSHTVNVSVYNYNEVTVIPNPTGMNIYGTVSSATGTNSLVSESFASCAAYTCVSTCNAISLVDTIHACKAATVALPATIVGTDSILSYLWSPSAGLSSSTILAPTLTVPAASAYYYLTVRSIIPFNLVTNGDFSAGNTGFTSSYTYSPGPSGVLLEGDYSVYNNPFSVHGGFTSFGDHTTGTGKMMIINGSPTPTDVWCQTIPVTPNTDYDFSAWIANCSSVTVGPDVPILQFKINGILIGTPTSITSVPGVWTNFFSVWNSGPSTTATICIYDLNTTAAGNDFVLDDISFREICVAKDSVYIDVIIPDTTTSRKDTTLCVTGAPLTLKATSGYASYVWSTGATTTTILALTSGTYWVRDINNCSIKIDTFRVNYISLPTIALGPDVAFCIGNTITLSSPQPPGSVYLWSTGSTIDSIVVGTTGTYWLQVDNGYCKVADTINITVSPYPIVDLGPDIFNCTGTSAILQSSVTYTSPAYLWKDGSTTPSITVTLPGTHWLEVTVAGCASADTINVDIIYDTFKLYTGDTAICRGKFVNIKLNANPVATFQWLPTAGIQFPHISSPKIIPDTSEIYRVTISVPGCPDLVDSIYIDVQPNPEVYVGDDKRVCEFDTLHLHAFVMPNWYTQYSYRWRPATYIDDSTATTVIFKAGDTTNLKLYVTTPAGCIGADSVMIFTYPGNFATLDTVYNLCPHDTVQFKPTGGASYRWHPALYLSDSVASEPWVYAKTNQSYTAIVTSQYGCKDTLSTSVVVRPSGYIFLGDSVVLFPGESYQIKAQTNCASFAWFPHAGLDNPYISNPLASPEISTLYIVEAKTEWGCDATDSINIYYDISSTLALPNAFTPGSSINNKLYIIKRGMANLSYFRIFNRWGNMVFETKNIDEGWDGSYKGKPQPLGVYVYEVEAVTNTGKPFRKHGNVTLIR